MNIFGLLWVLLVYSLWRSIPGNANTGGGWAFILGILAAAGHFFLESVIDPGGFQFSRWMSGFTIIVLPVLIPLLVYFLFSFFGFIKEGQNYAGFALAWIIPGAIFNAIRWSSFSDPILLILIPVLWTSIAIGVSFFIKLINPRNIILTILVSLGILAIPITSTSSYWAFFSHKTQNGTILLIISVIPMIVSVILPFFYKKYSY